MLPTPRVYARFPFYNLMNGEDSFAQVSLKPHARLTFYGAGVRGGAVQSGVYPAGGANPAARLFYAELTQRF